MKHIVILLMLSILTAFIIYGQHSNYSKLNDNKRQLIDSLKSSVDSNWIKDNPKLAQTVNSFFNKDNENEYFVGLLQISGLSVPFTWDDNFSLLEYLISRDSNIDVKQGFEADKNFKGTKISWKQKKCGLIWFNEKAYKGTINSWNLINYTECPGTIIFPILSFDKVVEIPNALTNNIQGLIIMPYDSSIYIKQTETIIKTENGKIINGFGYDINNDGIFDIFNFDEQIDDNTWYTRLFLNIDGHWKCKWIQLNEACL